MVDAINARSLTADSGTKQTPPGNSAGGFGRDLQSEPRLADAARAGEGHELHVLAAEELAESSRFLFASDKCGTLHRQIVGTRLGGIAGAPRRGGRAQRRGREPNHGWRRSALSDPWRGSAPRSKGTEAALAAFCAVRRSGSSRRMAAVVSACGLFLESGKSGDHLVEHRSERKLVGTKIDFAAGGLLRRHVADRAHHDSVLGDGGGIAPKA